jgi:hypothetical protein
MGPVVLEPTPASKKLTFRFDADRGEATRDVTIKATPPLTGTRAGEIEITASPLVREDQHATFRRPKFTMPRISRDGERITFTVCADPSGIQAGSYSGSLFVDGPANVTGASIDISATARSLEFFLGGLVLALLAAAAGLTLKGVADYRKELDGTNKRFKWPKALSYVWTLQELRLIFSLAGIVIAGIAAATVYNKNLTWGADWFVDGLALASAAIAAVGTQGVLDGLRGAATSKNE